MEEDTSGLYLYRLPMRRCRTTGLPEGNRMSLTETGTLVDTIRTCIKSTISGYIWPPKVSRLWLLAPNSLYITKVTSSFHSILIHPKPLEVHFRDTSGSLREIFWVVAGQLSNSLKIFVGQKKKVPDKNNRVLLNSNTSLSKYSKHCKFDGKQSKYTGNMCSFHPLKTKSPKILSVHISWL